MIQGLGNDIIKIARIRKSIKEHSSHFLDRIFTQKEQEYCQTYRDPAPHFAGRFAAKEAISKALGTGIGAHLSWHDLEILNDDHGKPVVHLSERLKKQYKNPKILLAISHCEDYATAIALWDV